MDFNLLLELIQFSEKLLISTTKGSMERFLFIFFFLLKMKIKHDHPFFHKIRENFANQFER